MSQFIRYLYESENGKKVRNIGFVKVENQGGIYIVHIHGKGVDFGRDNRIEVLVLWDSGGKLIGASQGYVENSAPNIHSILRFDANDVGGVEAFSQVVGILLRNAENKVYFASWREEELDLEHMIPLSEWEEEQAEELQVEEVEEVEEVDEYIPPRSRIYEKIQRQDLSRLPRKHWGLANNHFLIHGFYNYHHLLHITEEDHIWIGVPGIYHEKEEAMAKHFGFPQFHRVTDENLELTGDEMDATEDFGYWCRLIV